LNYKITFQDSRTLTSVVFLYSDSFMTYLLEFYMLGRTDLLKDRDWQTRYLSYISDLLLIFC